VADVSQSVAEEGATHAGVTSSEVVFKTHTVKLLRYRRRSRPAYREPLLLCYALINRPYILDLVAEKSVVRRYLERGFDVYMIDWGVPSYADRQLTLKDYVCEFLMEVAQFVVRRARCRGLHLLGYCMGGTMAALFAASNPRLVRTLTLLAAPIDFGVRETLLSYWTDGNYFDADALVKAYGNCPAWFLQYCFLFMKPVQNLVEKYIPLYEQMHNPRVISNFVAMERWVHDNIPVAGGVFLEFVKNFYRNNELIRGEFRLNGKRADLGKIACPLLLLTATKDHLVSPQSTEGIRPHVSSRDIRSMTIDGGHVGLVTGAKAQKTLWPRATRWLAQRSTATSVRRSASSATMEVSANG
jgi:polyhydroxyalkanoate synthase